MTTKRIEDVLSVEAVKAAYAKTGLAPLRGGWLGRDCACAAGVVCVATSLPPEGNTSVPVVAARLGVDTNELFSFVDGFDGWCESFRGGSVAARDHGRKVAEAVFGTQGSAS